MNRCYWALFMALAALLCAAQSGMAGTFANIVIDDAYSDWAGIPEVADADDTTTGPDIASVQIANDNTFLYIRVHYHSADSFPTYLAIDNDSNSATGFNIFGLGIVGSEAGYADDFDFDQRAGFNIGTLKDPVRLTEPESGSAILAPFSESIDRELAIRLDTTFDPAVGPGNVFPNDTFRLLLYSLDPSFGQADVTAAIDYTLAVPEPTTMALAAASLAAVGLRRRRF
jgi:PEP-CTERM motif